MRVKHTYSAGITVFCGENPGEIVDVADSDVLELEEWA